MRIVFAWVLSLTLLLYAAKPASAQVGGIAAPVPLFFDGGSHPCDNTTNYTVLSTTTVPVNTFAGGVGSTVVLEIGGTYIGSTDQKKLRVTFGSVLMALTTPSTSPTGLTTWAITVRVSKTGTNTQKWMSSGTNSSIASLNLTPGTSSGTLALTETGTIAVTVEGADSTIGTTGAVTLEYMRMVSYPVS